MTRQPRSRSGRVRGRLLASLAALVTGVAGIGGAVVVTAVPAQAAASATTILKSFNPADIISDAVMFDSGTMSQSAIQSFLNGKVPTCRSGYTCLKNYTQTTSTKSADPMCSTYTGAKNETSAAIIYKVGKACGVNPQALLVTLEKEQGLVTDTWPTSDQYRKSTGYACPDSTNVCDATYNGFFNQVYKAAWALKRYTTPPGTTGSGWTKYNWFPVGKPSGVLYNPNPKCGSKTITIKNKATASLYYYTPYQPNAAALAAGFGTGDSCSAYGNRNFFLYFTTWFGSTHTVTVTPAYAVTGAIQTLWTGLGGTTGVLGNPLAAVKTSKSNGGGTYQSFKGGTVYSSKAGTFWITGAIRTEYNRRGGTTGSMGWLAGAQKKLSGGTSQAFTGGDIYSSAAGTYAVREGIRTSLAAAGGVTGVLGFPKATAAALGSGVVQRFAKGSVYYTKTTGAQPVTGAADTRYVAIKGPSSVLGWPVKAASSATAGGVTGTVQSFQHGELYSSAVGTASVSGAVRTEYTARGGRGGALGWPVSEAALSTAAGGGTVQVFAKGRIYVPKSGTATTVTGAALSAYVSSGEMGSSLGWPAGPAKTVTAHGTTGVVQLFQGGGTYAVGKSSVTVNGAVFKNYQANKGPTGYLGWPKAAPVHSASNGGGWSQVFTGGTIFSNAKMGAHPLSGAYLRLYVARGGTKGSLGWPGLQQKVTANGGGTVVPFTSGRIYSSKAGTVAVRGNILTEYLAQNGPAGRLGWPTRGARAVGAAQVQTFKNGTITWTKAGGAKTRLG